MAKIKQVEFGYVKGLPGFSSIRVALHAEVNENDNLDKVFDDLRYEAERQADIDPSWLKGGDK